MNNELLGELLQGLTDDVASVKKKFGRAAATAGLPPGD
jgi:hypothetical protein